MPNIVKKDGCHSCGGFLLRNLYAFLTERGKSFVHKVHRSQRMQEPTMHSPWIDKETQSQLTNAIESLYIRMLQDLEKHTIRYAKKSKYRVIDDFARLCHRFVR